MRKLGGFFIRRKIDPDGDKDILYRALLHSVRCQAFLSIHNYTRRQINLYRLFCANFSVNSQPIFMKFCKDYFHPPNTVEFLSKNML